MSLITVQPLAGTNQNNGDQFYGWMGWKITTGTAPFKFMQAHVQPVYVTGPATFAIFDYLPGDFTDEGWLYHSDFFMDDSENYYAPEAADANFVLNASSVYYLCVRSGSTVVPMDYPFWDETGLLPVATTSGYFTIDAAVLENAIPSPPSSWPFPGPIYEITIETTVNSPKGSTLMTLGVG